MWQPAAKARCLAPGIHAANAGDNAAAGMLVEPGEFGMDLNGELAGWGDDQHQREDGRGQAFGIAQNGGGQGKAVSHCFP